VCSIPGSFPTSLPSFAKVEALAHDDAPLSYEKCALEVEVKPLSSSLRYEFLCSNSTYPVIVNASLNASQVATLLRLLAS